MAMLPSPTADATRAMAPARLSPAAKMPGTQVSSRYGSRLLLPRCGVARVRYQVAAREQEAFAVADHLVAEPIRCWAWPR